MITRADLPFLAEADPAAPHISMFMPTHRFGDQSRADQLRWKNLLNALEESLEGRLRPAEIDELLAPARELRDDAWGWQHMSDGVALFMRPGWHASYRVPYSVPEFSTVGDRLVLGPLFRLLTGDEQFLLLAISQRNLRLLEGDRQQVVELELNGVPTALRDVVEAQEPRSDTMARPAADAGTKGGSAVFYGHGAADEHFKKNEVTRFVREAASGLRPLLFERGLPLVLVGPDLLVSEYRGTGDYPHILDDAVIRNPDPLSSGELHRLAWPVIEDRLRAERSRLIEQFRSLHGTGRVSSDRAEIHEAALHGRVETLFVQADPWCWEQAASGPHAIVALGQDDRYAICEQIEAAAVATMGNGGLVHASSAPVDPDSPMSAIFRY